MAKGQKGGQSTADFEQMLARVHEIGRDIVAANADDVDKKARFPKEGIDALRSLKLMSCYVPAELGGMELSVTQTAKLCEALGQYCGSTAMVFAMHQIQVACLVNDRQDTQYIHDFLRRLVTEQRLIASATTEMGTGGDLRSSICAIEVMGDRFKLVKKAPVISYGEYADDIMVTCRRTAESPAHDQVQVLVHKADFKLEALSGWDTLGFRGTCSSGFTLTCEGRADQIQPVPFADVLSRSMHPFAHITWGSLWLGIATDAVNRARAFVRGEARRNPNVPPVSSLRLAETDAVLQTMRSDIHNAARDYDAMLAIGGMEPFRNFSFSIRTNNLKLNSSRLIVDVVGRAMLICGIQGYRNDSKFTLGRHIRDAYGAALMVNNDRIMNHNATMLLALREG